MYENRSFITLSRIQVSIMFNGVNLQRGNAFILVFVIYIAIEIIVIMSIIEILEILLLHVQPYFPILISKTSELHQYLSYKSASHATKKFPFSLVKT